jgi:[Skp1-protein]-hydroxyproline N-acetylglucosaminyltransferase
VKHTDAGPYQHDKSSIRKLTAILYLNHEPIGGELRVYNPILGSGQTNSYVDIKPAYGRLVIFRSESVEHEVLPSFSPRIAITIWASGQPIATDLSNTMLPQSISLPYYPPELICNLASFSSDIKDRVEKGSIFVSIAAYRDSECKHTVNNLFAMARYPHRIVVGILWQAQETIDGTAIDKAYLSSIGVGDDQVRLLTLSSSSASGPCYARHIVDSLRQDEQYLLQIDSHMRFRKNWDVYLISALEHVRETSQHQRPVLTTYPQGYELPSNISKDIRPTLLVPTSFDDHGMLRLAARILAGCYEYPIRSALWASGFSFSDAHIFDEVPYDPNLSFLFFGEELSMSAR